MQYLQFVLTQVFSTHLQTVLLSSVLLQLEYCLILRMRLLAVISKIHLYKEWDIINNKKSWNFVYAFSYKYKLV
jgi:hypothetical protein